MSKVKKKKRDTIPPRLKRIVHAIKELRDFCRADPEILQAFKDIAEK